VNTSRRQKNKPTNEASDLLLVEAVKRGARIRVAKAFKRIRQAARAAARERALTPYE
jgi:hypothetical protein